MADKTERARLRIEVEKRLTFLRYESAQAAKKYWTLADVLRYDADLLERLAAELAAAEKENKRLCDIVEKTADGHLLEQLAAAEAAEKATDDERRIVHELRDRVMALEKRNGDALKVLDVEIARMEELYESHSRADDYPRIVQSEAHLNGLKFARAALAASGAGEETT